MSTIPPTSDGAPAIVVGCRYIASQPASSRLAARLSLLCVKRVKGTPRFFSGQITLSGIRVWECQDPQLVP